MENKHIIVGSNSYEKVKSFKYLDSLWSNQNSIREEIKCNLKAGNSCYHSVQTLLFSRLLCKKLKIKIYKTIILSVVKQGVFLKGGTQDKGMGIRSTRLWITANFTSYFVPFT